MALCTFSVINRVRQHEAFDSAEVITSDKDGNANSDAMQKILRDIPPGPKNDGIVAPIMNDESRKSKDLGNIVPEVKTPSSREKGKPIEPSAPPNEIHQIKTILNKTLLLADVAKYQVSDKKQESSVRSSGKDSKLDPNIRHGKPMDKPNIERNSDKIRAKPLSSKAKQTEEQPAAPETAKSNGEKLKKSNESPSVDPSLEVKKDKDEIKLLEKIAEVQQEQKKMIEDIQKELKQEIALHKEIKANHSKENEFVELFEEKMKRIDKHMKEVDQMGNKTLKDIIETGHIKATKVEEDSVRTGQQKGAEFKDPLKILNNRIQEQVRKNLDTAEMANTYIKEDSQRKKDGSVSDNGAHRVEPSLPVALKPQMDTGKAKDFVVVSEAPVQRSPSGSAPILSGNIVASVGQERTPVQYGSLSGQEKAPDEGAPLVHIQEPKIEPIIERKGNQKSAEEPKKSIIIPIEKPALLSEVTKDQGPALMKNLESSAKQNEIASLDKKHLPPEAQPLKAESVRESKEEPKKAEVRNGRTTDNTIDPQIQSKESAVMIGNKSGKPNEEQASKVGTAPLVIKMNPAVANVSRKETVHKEI